MITTSVVACGTLPTELTLDDSFSVHTEPVLFIVATKQKAEAVTSLRSAGFTITDDIVGASHLLRITLGVDKSFQSCGTLNNVTYALSASGRRVLRARSRGWTGSCEPNVFDELSQAMAQAFRQNAARRGGKGEDRR